MSKFKLKLFVSVLAAMAVTGCATKGVVSNPKRTISEQVLLDQSLEKTLVNASLPLPPGKSIAVEVASLNDPLGGDNAFVEAAVKRWLGQQGFRLPGDKQETYLLRVTAHSFTTNVGESFAGVPPISGGLFPIATPEMAIAKHNTQRALTRLSMDVFDRASGRLLMTTPSYEGTTYLRDSTYLFGIPHATTDLGPDTR